MADSQAGDVTIKRLGLHPTSGVLSAAFTDGAELYIKVEQKGPGRYELVSLKLSYRKQGLVTFNPTNERTLPEPRATARLYSYVREFRLSTARQNGAVQNSGLTQAGRVQVYAIAKQLSQLFKDIETMAERHRG